METKEETNYVLKKYDKEIEIENKHVIDCAIRCGMTKVCIFLATIGILKSDKKKESLYLFIVLMGLAYVGNYISLAGMYKSIKKKANLETQKFNTLYDLQDNYEDKENSLIRKLLKKRTNSKN